MQAAITTPAFIESPGGFFVAQFCQASQHDVLVPIGESPASRVYKALRYGIFIGFAVEPIGSLLWSSNDLLMVQSPVMVKSKKTLFDSGVKDIFQDYTGDLIWVSSGDRDIISLGRKI